MVNVDNYAHGVASIHLVANVENIETGSLLDCIAVSVEKGPFWLQNITPDRRLFVTQWKDIIFWLNKKFLKAYDLFLFVQKN